MPGLDTFAAATDIRLIRPDAKIGVLTRCNQPALLNRTRRARLNGLIFKQDGFEELSYAIRTMFKGGFYTPPSLSSALIEPTMDPDPVQCLTEREKSVFVLKAQSYQTKDIANTLNISVKTAETHLNNIRRKLGHSDSLAASDCRVIFITGGCLLDSEHIPIELHHSFEPITAGHGSKHDPMCWPLKPRRTV